MVYMSKWDIMGEGPFAHKPWCTNKWDIRGDPLLINHGVRIRGDPLLKIMVYEQVGHKGGPFAKKNMVYEQVG